MINEQNNIMNNIIVHWYIIFNAVSFSMCFSSYINLQTSVERIAGKMQNLLAKKEPECAL